MFIWSSFSGANNFSNTRIGRRDTSSLTVHSGRNMYVSGQLLLRDTDNDFAVNSIQITGLPQNVAAEYSFAENIVFNDGFPYPDILLNKKSIFVKKNYTQIVWICLHVPKDAEPGKKSFKIKVFTDRGEFTAAWKIHIHSFCLDEPENSFVNHEYFFSPTLYFSDTDEPRYDYPRFSGQWWALMREYAASMKKLRVNCLYLQALELLSLSGSRRIGKNKWNLDFTLLGRFVDVFLENGSFKYISIAHIVSAADGTTIHYLDEKGQKQQAEADTPLANAWAEVFYSSLYGYFKQKNRLHMLRMHLQDEPHSSAAWKWAREKCRKFMPDIRCGEPLDTHAVALELPGYCDCYIPRIEIMESNGDFYKERQAKGDEVWVYSCCYPEQSWFLNKFIDQPHQYSRLMEWTCFYKGVTGFLHWGYNQWHAGMYGLAPDARFKGDGFIVYPDAENNSVLDSARGIETLEGMQEWEMLVHAGRKAPDEVKKIVEAVTKGFDSFRFDPSGRALENAKAKLLALLD